MSYCFWLTCVQPGTPPGSSPVNVMPFGRHNLWRGGSDSCGGLAGRLAGEFTLFLSPTQAQSCEKLPFTFTSALPSHPTVSGFSLWRCACVGWRGELWGRRPKAALGRPQMLPATPRTNSQAQPSPALQPQVRLPKRMEEMAKPADEGRSEGEKVRDRRGKSKEWQAALSSIWDWSRPALPPVESPRRGRGEREGEGEAGETGKC